MIEVEAKFLVPHEEIREKLKSLGGRMTQPLRQMTRQNAEIPGRAGDGSWIRVRDEGDGNITMSFKQVTERTLSGTREICVGVDDFQKSIDFLKEVGIVTRNIQQTRRESWELAGASIDLDEWPWVPPYIEIEAPDEATVKHVAEMLGLSMKDALYGSVEPVYIKHYDVTEDEVNAWTEIIFTPEVPEWLEKKRRKTPLS
ncbi:MAG: class IV adenylate cyclase [Candidatus Saccharimonadales bacterium]